jgi:hypothetical protein
MLGALPEASQVLLCAECGDERATCVGVYDGADHAAPACDACCGHGCEDGRCYMVVAAEDEDEWSCSCGSGGSGSLDGAHAHLKRHLDQLNVRIAAAELEG